MWEQAPENTLESLRHAIQHNDGIEFDVRLTQDQELVIHHDGKVSVPKEMQPHSFSWTENHTLEELTSLGFISFRSMLEDAQLRSEWVEHGKMGCIEFKRPHPRALYGGGFFGKKQHISHVATMMEKTESILKEFEVPSENTVYYSFHTGMKSSIHSSKVQRPWAELVPYVPPFGNYYTKRMRSGTQFFLTSLSRLIKSHRRSGASMSPCAVEYFLPPQSLIPLGYSGGLYGAKAARLSALQRGFPIYVWPTELRIEHDLLSAGLTGLTDCSDPNTTWLPSGHARWTQPATRPLDAVQQQKLDQATHENHLEILRELKMETCPWAECDDERRRELVTLWRKKWQWENPRNSILQQSTGASPPWESIRLIGHRGSGKTSRPVFK
ncbi:MAG: hypothetical protein CBC59_002230 [Euryarchaeota archaeon TMED99]|nr:MAG: hypothetical protein CBC59_002230 [Euryarchaeota archaeon TMED99]